MADTNNTTPSTTNAAVSTTAAAPSTTPAAPAKKKVDIKSLEIFIIVDTSGSMRKKDAGPGKNQKRLDATQESALAFTDYVSKFDDDGVTIIRFASKVDVHDGVTVDTLENIFAEFNPMGGTATDQAIQKAADMYFQKAAQRKSKGEAFKSAFLAIFTDGAPETDASKKNTAKVIVDITKKIKDRSEFGMIFFQVGNDQEATDFLDKLNNDLDGVADHDIVAVRRLEDMESVTIEDMITEAFTE